VRLKEDGTDRNMVSGVVHVYVELAGDEEFMRCGCYGGEERSEFVQNVEKC